ncbi:MAG: lysophospholipid acyltransferase family protein [Gillisia sp.]
MQLLVFWLVYPLLWLISRLPFRLFYTVSDILFFIVYRVIGYRKKTVTANLKLAFPEKSSEEIQKIRNRFYRHMCDMFLEMIKSISISEKELRRRFVFTNLEEIERLQQLEKSVILICGHYASYEWANAIQLYPHKYKSFGIYKKIRNPYFDRLIKKIRERFNADIIPNTKAPATMLKYQRVGILGIYAMIADQSPKINQAKYRTTFMDHLVPVFVGSEKLAVRLDMAVVYLHVEKTGRGFYKATFKTITDTPKTEPEFSITRRYFDLLEEQIKEKPEYYLWTHKRWKHMNAPTSKEVQIF